MKIERERVDFWAIDENRVSVVIIKMILNYVNKRLWCLEKKFSWLLELFRVGVRGSQ